MSVPSAEAQAPAIIYIIRHGEKPADSPPPTAGQPPAVPIAPFGVDFDGNQNGHSLLPRGWQRSGALTVLLAPAGGTMTAGLLTPTALFSPNYGNSAKTAEHRTYQTIQSLSERLGIPINSPYAEGQEAQLAAAVVSGSSGVVLICWEHDHIPALASSLPTAPGTTIPSTWPSERFDVIWSFTATQQSSPVNYTFSQVPQQLLSGDTDTVIPTS